MDLGAEHFGIPPAETAGVAQKATWPNPGKMPNFGIDPSNRPPDREFLAYLNDWFYREMSAQAHLSAFGLTKLGALLLRRDLPEEQSDQIENEFYPRHRSIQVSRTAILLLCLISEIDRHFGFGLSVRIVEIWDVLNESVPEAAEIFEKRYATLWAVPKIGS